MKVSRRQTLGLLAGAAVVGGCGRVQRWVAGPPPHVGPPAPGDDPHARFLGRFAFGARPGEVSDLRRKGQEAWLHAQLSPGDEPLVLASRLRGLEINNLSPFELRDWPDADVMEQLQQGALLRAVHSPWQLRERCVDFWNNHFNVYARKGLAAYRAPLNERRVVRQNVFGQFGTMLRASARSTAMLVYLDQQASSAARPNENYARELMELHTLGVDGGYSQRDVMEVARCFTGWTEERGFLRAKGSFKFDPRLHDDGEKVVLGHRIPAGGGIKDGERVLEVLTAHPATAKHVSSKFARFFLGESVSQPTLAALEGTWRETQGDLRALIRATASAPEALSGPPVLKRPLDYLVSCVRALDGETDGGAPLQRHLEAMGQPLYQWPMPDGYPDATEAWTGSVLARWNFALALVEGQIGGTRVDTADLARRFGAEDGRALVSALFAVPPDSAPAKRVADIVGSAGRDRALALTLASPEFQWR